MEHSGEPKVTPVFTAGKQRPRRGGWLSRSKVPKVKVTTQPELGPLFSYAQPRAGSPTLSYLYKIKSHHLGARTVRLFAKVGLAKLVKMPEKWKVS